MGLPGMPKIDFDIGATVREFLQLMRDMNAKLDTLIEIQRGEAGCAECDVRGSLNCRLHGRDGTELRTGTSYR